MPKLRWEDIRQEQFIGNESFDFVMLATLQQDSAGRSKGKQIAVKQQTDITGHESDFVKEARLWHKLNKSKNIEGFPLLK